MRVRMYADESDEGYLVGLLTLSYEAPAKGRAVSTATWYHASLARLLMERYGATQKRAVLTVIRDPADARAYGRIKRALEKLQAGEGYPQTIPDPIIERARKLL